MTNNKLTKEQIQAIKDYGNQITTIELFVDSVRKNPGEYLSSTGNEGWFNALREMIQNATDEEDRQISSCDWVAVHFNEITQGLKVQDNGRGIPKKDAVRVFSREHTSTNFNKVKGEYPSGLHGVGVKCTNAVSSRFTIIASILGKGYKMEFSEGKPLKQYKDGPKDCKANFHQGTLVEALPDVSIMGVTTITCQDIINLLEGIVPLMHIGARVEFFGTLRDGRVIHKDIVNQDGVATFLIKKSIKPFIKPIIIAYDNGEMKAEIAMTYVCDLNRSADITTFANKTPVNTMLSTPSKGFIKGVSEFFRDYMNQIFLANNKRIEATSSDVTTGLVAVCAAYHWNVMFDSQAKNVCKNEELEPFVKDLVKQSLQEWIKTNPDDLTKLCNFFKDAAVARTKADRERQIVSKKYKTDDFTELPKGFVKAERKDNLELFIVEGLSASSPCETSRDSLYQSIYPIRGKLPNAFDTTREKFLANQEVKDMLSILGGGVGKNFDISKCKYEKIIIMTDADYDGFHIRVLLLSFLLMYCRPLVEEGRVYAALSPLYHLNKGTKNWKYFTDMSDVNKYVKKEFCKNYTIYCNKKLLSPAQINILIDKNLPYLELMYKISNNYTIYPVLLEDIIINRTKSFKEFKKSIEKKYKYINVEKKQDSLVITGLVSDENSGYTKDQMIILNDRIFNAFSPLFPFVDNTPTSYVMNGMKVGLYEILNTFENAKPKNMERAKGLGALNAYEIGVSTLSPANRKLLRYTTKDIMNAIEEIRRINSNRYSLIEGVDISSYEF